MIAWASVAPRPPYSGGQVSPSHRPADSSFSQRSRTSQAAESSGPPTPRYSANSPTKCESSQRRTSSANAWSSGKISMSINSRPQSKPQSEPIPVISGRTEHHLSALGPLEVQVGGMLPGEADAAVHLDGVPRDLRVGRGAVHLGQAGGQRHILAIGGQRPEPVVGRRTGRLGLGEHVRAQVLDGLERADRPSELHPHPRVAGRHLYHPQGTSGLLGGQQDGGGIEDAAEYSPAVALVA